MVTNYGEVDRGEDCFPFVQRRKLSPGSLTPRAEGSRDTYSSQGTQTQSSAIATKTDKLIPSKQKGREKSELITFVHESAK